MTTSRQLGAVPWEVIFFLITFALNFWVISRGISAGIELLNKIGMPLLFALGIALAVRVLSLGTPNPSLPDQNLLNGLGFLWNPDFTRLMDVNVWMAAAGQIFFTLSVGMGVILSYASYLRKNDDVAHSALSSAATNEFAEVILGGSIVIPAAFVFLGAVGAREDAESGSFNLGFVTMPLIFNQMTFGSLIGLAWFGLLFIAGVTSSVSLIQPILTFMQDELKYARKQATILIGAVTLVAGLVLKWTLAYGTVDELNFWGGTFLPVVSALVMIWMFGWVMGTDQGWAELTRGSGLRVPVIAKYVIKYITPLYLLVMLVLWLYRNTSVIAMTHIAEPKVWKATLATRAGMVILIAVLLAAIYYAGRGHLLRNNEKEAVR